MYTIYINNTLPPALAVHEIYRDIFGPPMVLGVFSINLVTGECVLKSLTFSGIVGSHLKTSNRP